MSRLAATLEDIGRVLVQTGDPAGALHRFEEALAIDRRLVELDPTNGDYALSLAAILVRTGDVLLQLHDAGAARRRLEESGATLARLESTTQSTAQIYRVALQQHVSLARLTDRLDDWKRALAFAEDMNRRALLPPEGQPALQERRRRAGEKR